MGNPADRALVPLAALSCSLLLGGCAHERNVKLSPREVPRIVEEYGANARVTVEDDGHPVEVTPQWQPVLEVRYRCSVPDLPDCKRLRAPLESVRLDAGVLRSSRPVVPGPARH